MLNKYLNLITIIPWIFLFLTSTFWNMNDKLYQKFNFNHLKRNIFEIFRLDTLFLIIVFFYFASFNKVFVDKYLFAVISIYLLVNSFYEKKKHIPKNFFQEHFLSLIFMFIFMLIPLGIYLKYENIVLTYKILFLMYFLEYFLIILSTFLSIKLKKRPKC